MFFLPCLIAYCDATGTVHTQVAVAEAVRGRAAGAGSGAVLGRAPSKDGDDLGSGKPSCSITGGSAGTQQAGGREPVELSTKEDPLRWSWGLFFSSGVHTHMHPLTSFLLLFFLRFSWLQALPPTHRKPEIFQGRSAAVKPVVGSCLGGLLWLRR